MLNILGRVVLFLSSYTPLLILGIKAAPQNLTVAVSFVIVGLLSGLAMLGLLAWMREVNPTPVSVESATPGSGDVVAYLFTYIVPFVGASTVGAADVLAFVVLIVTIGFVFVHSDLVLVNPLLAGAGFYLHRVETPGKRNYLILNRNPLPPASKSEIRVRRLGDFFGVEAT